MTKARGKSATRRAIERVIRFRPIPYNPFRTRLYSVDELMSGYDRARPGRSLDARIARHVKGRGRKHPDMHEALAQRIHDHSIDSALYKFARPRGRPRRRILGLMGSHTTPRNSDTYRAVAELAWVLRQGGYTIVSGGGPGTMEAANLGAYLSGYPRGEIDTAIGILAQAPEHTPDRAHFIDYIAAANEVRLRYPRDSGESLAVPTWAYPDEPTGLFSSRIAKYFANSIREDGLLALALEGVVFAPGGEGTLQEVFQDANHNAYWTFHARAPMVFLEGAESFYSRAPSIVEVVRAQAARAAEPYEDYVGVCTTAEQVLSFLQSHPAIYRPQQAVERTFGRSNLTLK